MVDRGHGVGRGTKKWHQREGKKKRGPWAISILLLLITTHPALSSSLLAASIHKCCV
jgi:hypothetical protein